MNSKVTAFPPSGGALLEIIDTCVHCGLCHPVCPTYTETFLEASSPRGRIALMKAVAERRLSPLDSTFVYQMGECLACRACEAACPGGVEYGVLIEAAREQLGRNAHLSLLGRFARWVSFQLLLVRPSLLCAAASVVRFYCNRGFRKAIRRSGMLDLFRIRHLDQLLPDRIGPSMKAGGGQWPAHGEKRGNAALLVGCLMGAAFGHIHRATISVLNANGITVEAPSGQVCCGALHAHSGYIETAKFLGRRNVDVFRKYDAVIVNASGCAAHMAEYHKLLAGDPEYSQVAKEVASKVYDLAEFLAGLGPRQATHPLQGMTVTYQDACHQLNVKKVSWQPRMLLTQVAGAQLKEPSENHICCGSAGIYNVVQPQMAGALGRRKARDLLGTGASTVVTSNVGCLLQIQAAARREGLPLKVYHLAEVLEAAYTGASL